MGKKGGSSWLTAVKRAFRSPTKDDDEKKREKRRWIFRKPANHQEIQTTNLEQNHALAVAEAAMATARAAAEVVRLTRPLHNAGSDLQHLSAIVIQTAFRGYLARRALRALKGLVKLQALVRGHNVRKQAKTTLQCMQALVRVQSRVLDQRMRLSLEGSRKSTFSDSNSSVLESRYLPDFSERKSACLSREGSSLADDWDERPHTIEEVKAMLQHRKDVALKRDKILSHSFSQQIWKNGRSPSVGNETELEETKWMDQWMARKPWESKGRASMDHRPEPIKTVEIDTSRPYSYLASDNFLRLNNQTQYRQLQRPASPLHRAHHKPNQQHLHHQYPVTPSPSKTRPIQVRSASPHCIREDRSHITSQTPNLRLKNHSNSNSNSGNVSAMPNYMAATESAKSRVRSQSAPRQRPSTPERERVGTARKRLSYPVPDPYNGGMGYGVYGNNLRSPSFKSICGSHVGLEQQSNYSSCYTESHGGEISPSSTTDLRRWLR